MSDPDNPQISPLDGDSDPTFKALLEMAQSGDAQVVNDLIERFSGRIQALVRVRLGKTLGAKIQVEDVVQETFFRAIRDLKKFEYQGEDSFFHWLSGIAHHVLLESTRKHKKEVILPSDHGLGQDSVTASRNQARHERFDRLEGALNLLSKEYREVILLARIERLPIKEVASKMGRSPEATSQLLWRALKKLKEQFGSTDSFHLPHRTLKKNDGDSEDKTRDLES